ncbi:hypothetical protein J3E64_001540 [Sphingobium sp. OAS761]|nr:hypothetical protein [Sphingobium sp. OAS761]
MAHLEGDSLNELFSTLADWNRCLSYLPDDPFPDFDGVPTDEPSLE